MDFLKQPYSNVIGKRPFNAGEVILFPSWLEHGVAPSTKNTTRISIACNFLIHGNLGKMAEQGVYLGNPNLKAGKCVSRVDKKRS